MSDISLFKLNGSKVAKKQQVALKLEKEIQNICENNLTEIFGIRFVKSEHSTGANHGGRIDSLGLDENNCPVIIEYKLDSKENVINQGLYYLDWLMDHKAEFESLCFEKLGNKIEIDWSNPRLLCIAQDFTKFDDHAIRQIDRNIELIRYKVFEDNYYTFELTSAHSSHQNEKKGLITYKGIKDHHKKASEKLNTLFVEIENYIMNLGDDVQKKELKFYYAYTRIRNFACIEIHPREEKIVIFLRLDPNSILFKWDNIRDVSKIGHYGTGDTEITIRNIEDLELAKGPIEIAYTNS